MKTQNLHAGWTLEAIGGPVPDGIANARVAAQVPGSVHTDLMRAGLIPDPYVGCNEQDLKWMHRASWRFSTSFTSAAADPGERVDLVFEGLDTVATIELNGTRLGTTANQHRSYRFDIAGLVRDGENSLVVSFASALDYAEGIEAAIGSRPRDYPHPMNAVRKMAASFGWDWGPDLQTAGIWRPVRLERWTEVRLEQVRPLVTLGDDGTGHVDIHVDLEKTGARPLRVTAHLTPVHTAADADAAARQGAVGDTCAARAQVLALASAELDPDAVGGRILLELPDAPVWWPAGYGEHPLVTLTVTVTSAEDDVVLDSYTRRIGFRNVEIDTTPDEHGTPFTILINGRPIFVKGAKWIPNDHLLTRVTREQLIERVDQAVGAHMNLLRVWGGGIYESEDFYDVCDERGILVWQDFLLACAAYAEEAPLWDEIEAEARENVARLVSHASLILWNGGNENLWAYLDWNWKPDLGDRTWGLGYYVDLFPRIVAELDPTRPYIPGSPFSPGFTRELASGESRVHPNDPDHGPSHEWGVWNRRDYTTYRDRIPRMCSEFGFQGPPTWATLTRVIPPHALAKDSPEFLNHQKAGDGNLKLDRGLEGHLPPGEDFEQWHWLTQLNQAHAVSFGIEHFRSHWPRTAGSIVWQLNDCWPVTSWAAVDGDGRAKPLLYALRKAYAPRLLTVQPRDGALAVVVVNDHDEEWGDVLELERLNVNGDLLATHRERVRVAPRATATVVVPTELGYGTGSDDVLVVRMGTARAIHDDVPQDRLPGAGSGPSRDAADVLDVTTSRAGEEYLVSVIARAYVRDVTVVADRVAPDAVVDDALVTLLPGERHTFRIHTAHEVGHEEFASCVRSATHLGGVKKISL